MSTNNSSLLRNALYGNSAFSFLSGLACLLFAAAETLQIQLQGMQGIPSQFVQMIPYVLTIVAVGGFVARSTPPAALGKVD